MNIIRDYNLNPPEIMDRNIPKYKKFDCVIIKFHNGSVTDCVIDSYCEESDTYRVCDSFGLPYIIHETQIVCLTEEIPLEIFEKLFTN